MLSNDTRQKAPPPVLVLLPPDQQVRWQPLHSDIGLGAVSGIPEEREGGKNDIAREDSW